MKPAYTVKELQEGLASAASVGLVPTMGALHAGHISLVERARCENDVVVVSIFVNPTQFNDKNDLLTYPRDIEADLRMLKDTGADFVFIPDEKEVYPQEDTRVFDFGQTDKVMEGASRPGHFNGVAQVVSRLFDMVKPKRAYFGEKDFQQVAVINALVKQLYNGIEIVPCPIVREPDGLAMSSRNVLLTPEHRAAAPHINAAMQEAVRRADTMSVRELEKWVSAEIEKNPLLKVIYFQIVDQDTLTPAAGWSDGTIKRGFIAVQAGAIRLIDNIAFV